jgi:hypothetical protein
MREKRYNTISYIDYSDLTIVEGGKFRESLYNIHSLKLQKVRLVTLLQAERGGEILLEERGLLDLSKKSLVDSLLVGNTLSLNFLLLTISEELLLRVGLLGLLFTGEVGDTKLVDVDTVKSDSGGGGDNITSVDSSEWDTVDLEWTSDEESVVLKRLEEDHSLTTETTSKDDQDSAWDERRAKLLRLSSLSSGLWGWGWLGLVPLLSLVFRNDTLATVLSLDTHVSTSLDPINDKYIWIQHFPHNKPH